MIAQELIEKIRAEIKIRLSANGAFDEEGDSAWHYDQGMIDAYNYILSFLSDLEKEEKPNDQWSEEDEEMLNSIIATCKLAQEERDSSPARHLFKMQERWLKSHYSNVKSEKPMNLQPVWHDVEKETPTSFGEGVIVLCKNKNKEDGIWLTDFIPCWEGEWKPRDNWETPVKWAYVRDFYPSDETNSFKEQPVKTDIVEDLKHYLATTPKEQIEKDWESLKEWGKVGPSVSEFLGWEQLVSDGLEKEIKRWLKEGEITDTHYDDYGDSDIEATARHFYELGCRDTVDCYKERSEELVCEELEEEISRYLREECSNDDEPSVSEIARHFYELGKQGGSSEKPSEVLEEEFKKYWDEMPPDTILDKEAFANTARHFAQWGAEHFASAGKTSSGSSEIPNDLEEAALSRMRDPDMYLSDAVIDEVGDELLRMALFGAKWQKEQMMKNALHGWLDEDNEPPYDLNVVCEEKIPFGKFKHGDKVKLIIIKEE